MKNQGLGDWIARRRIKSEGETAIIWSGGTYTFDQYADRVARLAQVLADRGLAKRDRLVYLGNNHPDFLTTFFACGLLGAIFVPLNTRLAPRELEYMIEDSGAVFLVTHESVRDLARAAAWSTGIRKRLVVDGEADLPAVESVDEAMSTTPPFELDVEVSLDDPAMILYTSGTTGRPKGAVLTHGNLTWNVLNAIVDYDVTREEVAMMMSPMFHVAALSMGALPTLLKGGAVVLHERFDAGDVLHAIEEHGITSLSGVPTTFQFLAEDPAWNTTDLSSIRKLTCGGSAMPLRVIEAYEARGLAFSSGYGMTEASPGATSLPVSKARDHAGTSGLAHFFTDVRVVGEDGTEMPVGEPGEIQISGPNVIREYWRRPEATAEARDGEWFRTGDIGRLDEDGYLTVTDRLKDMIISGGENVYPAEIEQLVMEMPEVRSVAVIGVPDDRWGEVPLAIVAIHEGTQVTPEDVLGHVRGRVAKYKLPRAAVLVDDLPRTASGKVRKVELRERFRSLPDRAPES
ncbi:acyl-CoA synthetase [Demequina zhanjiangensis]|uniref:Long-chain fatty acid--CoA ligase n=1 Tax=Demequina zhanjiangensis TaxID=3051659 RepID=A0ABT8G2F9_9MICO|nr:long-chain fatty acid--CoA ligase [Demequina sp. SYSU T00b26]MDN4473197.1 long-chain fatty acid--CoA ligase [Demequina sp. SYSU T00b26]